MDANTRDQASVLTVGETSGYRGAKLRTRRATENAPNTIFSDTLRSQAISGTRTLKA